MKTISFLEQIRPRAYARYQALPLFGSIIADYSVWLRQRNYTTKTIRFCLKGIRHVEGWLRRKGRGKLADLSDRDMRAVHDRFRADSNVGGVARSLGTFLVERGLITVAPLPPQLFSQPWAQLAALLRSIERTTPMGLRDFTILFLVARYGLRSCELVALKLEDFDWRTGTIRIQQSKTKQTLLLPLTDEAGDIVARYLREAWPASPHRTVFLRERALLATAVHDILESQVRRSGLPIKTDGTHFGHRSAATRARPIMFR